MTNDSPLGATSAIEFAGPLDHHAQMDPPSSDPSTGVGPNTGDGGSNESSINWPSGQDEFWRWPRELQVEWVIDRQAEQRFDQQVDRYLQEAHLSGFPESVKEALNGLSWQLLLNDQKAYAALRAGDVGAVKQFIEQARGFIQNVASEYENFTSRGPMDQLISDLGPKSSNSQRALQGMRRQAAPRPPARHAEIRDQVIEQIFGPGASKR